MRDDGRISICKLENIAEDGLMPVEKLVELARPFHCKRTINDNIRYVAMGNTDRVVKLIRINNVTPTLEDILYDAEYAVIRGVQYRIKTRQEIVDKDAMDLTLERLEEFLDVVNDDTNET